MNANLYRYRECPHCKTALTNENVIGLSDGSSIQAWQCKTCGHEWPRHSFIRNFRKLNDLTQEKTDEARQMIEHLFPAPGHTDLMISPEAVDDAIRAMEDE